MKETLCLLGMKASKPKDIFTWKWTAYDKNKQTKTENWKQSEYRPYGNG